MLHLNLPISRFSFVKKQFRVKPAWNRATEDQLTDYSDNLRLNLDSIPLPFNALRCRDVNCRDAGHLAAVNAYVEKLSASCLSAASYSIPTTSARGSGRVPGWVEYVEPFRQKSQFWHNLWVENGRPKTGVVSDIMRKTRAAYHRAVRHVKRNEQDIINDRFASAILNNRSRDFWSEVKRIRHNRTCFSNCVDSAFNPTDIANVFADKYQELYTAVAYNADDMVCLKNKIADLVSTV